MFQLCNVILLSQVAMVLGRLRQLAVSPFVLEHKRVPASVTDLVVEVLLVWVPLPNNIFVIPMIVQINQYLIIIIEAIHSCEAIDKICCLSHATFATRDGKLNTCAKRLVGFRLFAAWLSMGFVQRF